MKQSIIELILSLFWGVAAYLMYIQLLGMVSAYTVDLFRFVKYVPCDTPACSLRLIVYYTVFLIHDTVIGLPVLVLFGMVLGLSVSSYHLSRPLLLSAGFLLTQGYYLFIRFDFGYSLPVYVEAIRAIVIAVLLILFTKLGCTIKRKADKKRAASVPAARDDRRDKGE